MKNALIFALNHIRMSVFKRRLKPRELQLPITGRCNSRCLTCNIWKQQNEAVEIDSTALEKVLRDPFFSEIKSVGINGGEPSMYGCIEELLNALFVLPKLNRIHVISNGLIAHKLMSMMEVIQTKCSSQNIKVYLTISLDGIGEIHNQVRGIPTAFRKTMETLELIRQDSARYCDVLDIGCTLSEKNIVCAVEIETYLKERSIPVYFHPAVPNRRLHNFESQNFSVMNSIRSRMLATEYFFGKFKYGHGLRTRGRAFLTFYYLLHKGQKRLAGCNYLRSDVTIDENLNLFLCATASHKIGSLREKTASDLLKDGLLDQEELVLKKQCDSCVHYIVFPSCKGAFLFLCELLKPLVWIKYKILAIWLRLL